MSYGVGFANTNVSIITHRDSLPPKHADDDFECWMCLDKNCKDHHDSKGNNYGCTCYFIPHQKSYCLVHRIFVNVTEKILR